MGLRRRDEIAEWAEVLIWGGHGCSFVVWRGKG